MLSFFHNVCRLASTSLAAATCILGPLSPKAGANPPDPDAAFSAYRAVEQRVRAWSKEPIAAPALSSGVCLTLRFQGEVVARAAAFPTDGASSPLDAALKQALEQAEFRLPLPSDATRPLALATCAADITISLELAGELLPFAPEALADASLLISPGLEGLAARAGDRVFATFPAQMLSESLPPGRALASLVAQVSGDPAAGLLPLQKVRTTLGVEFYRFHVTHLAQTDPEAQPTFLRRGGHFVPQSTLSGPGLRAWRDDLARHLLAVREAAPGGATIRGTLDPVTGQAEPATMLQRALAALALAEAGWTPLDQPATPLMTFATELTHAAASETRASPALLDDPGAAAAWLLVISGDVMPRTDAGIREPFAQSCRLRVRALAQNPGATSPALLALVACALVTDGASGDGGAESLALGRALTTQLLRDTPPGQVVALMPWLAAAQKHIADAEGSEIPGLVTLRQTRALLWQNQLTAADAGDEAPDLTGGIVFTKGSVPLPSWHAVRPLAFVAAMLGDRRMTPDAEVASELPRLLASLRFFRQLTADEYTCHMYRSRDTAHGGVRAALWDQRMPPEATAMTLLTVQATLDSLDEIAQRRSAASNP